ncbi:MAG: sigma-70 family RNA polymerase sigma factor [Firmicutes bacterium]|nr:sigma-70 family RNA polymerase sigma factor [Bacillota bacterium]
MDIKEKEVLLCTKYDDINRLLIIQNVPRQDRDDLLQDIFINALRSLRKLRDPEKMDAWLWKITRNELSRYWRGSIRSRDLVRSTDTEDFEAQMPYIDDAHYRGLEEEIDQVACREELRRALSRLPEKTLVVFRLYYFEGYKLKEISQITGENISTIKSRHARGLAHLRQLLITARTERQLEEDETMEDALKKEISI